MKICFLGDADSIHVAKWVNAFVNKNYQVYLLTLPYKKTQSIDERVTVKELKYSGAKGYYLNFFEAKKIIKKIKPDLLNVHYASGYGTLSRLINFKPSLLSVWGSDVYIFPYQGKIKKRILEKNLDAASVIASTSNAMKSQTLKFTNKKSKEVYVTPFGIDTEVFKPAKKTKKTKITIGTVKTLKEVYGIEYLIKSFKEIEDINPTIAFEFLLVGHGNIKKYEALVKEMDFKNRVIFTGGIQHKDVPTYLNMLDIYCAPSLSESFGVAILEASACGLPVVVSDVGGLPEVVEDGVTGFIVPSQNVTMLTGKINELVRNKSLRISMSKEGRKFVETYYSWPRSVEIMEEVYFKLM